MKRLVSGIMLTLLLTSMLTLALNIQPVKASGTIYIRADGSIDPPTAPIQRDGDRYVFTGNINDSIVVERDNILVDGAGYTLQGSGSGNGFYWSGINNVTIKNTNIKNFNWGFAFYSSSGNSISGNNITNNGYGILLAYSSNNSTISGNNIANNEDGIILDYSCSNIISGNIIAMNAYAGIWLFGLSSDNSIYGNLIKNNDYGIYHYIIGGPWAGTNDISGNIITNNTSYGLWLRGSGNDTISGNAITNNGWSGVCLMFSPNNVFKNNSMVGIRYNFDVQGGYVQDIDTSNTVDGKPICYWVNRQNMEVPSDSGFVALVNSYNITVRGLEIKNNCQGILLAFTTNSKITSNSIMNNGHGVYVYYSSNNFFLGNDITNNVVGVSVWNSSNNAIAENSITNNTSLGVLLQFGSYGNTVSGNNIAENNECGIWLDEYSNYNSIFGSDIVNNGLGIYLYSASNNIVYHNSFLDNTEQQYSYDSMNIWDNGYPIGGNYWSDYTGVDLYSGPNQDQPGSDGIWDHPYVIDENNQDRYPLVNPWTPTPTYVHGIDVSHHQGDIDWSEVYGTGYRFAYVKASEGVGWIDPDFTANMDNGCNAGLLMGAYHLGRPDLGNSAHDEAHFFVDTSYGYLTSGYLRPVLRVSTGASMGKEALSNWIIQWVEEVRSLTNAEPLIQVTSEYANYYLDPSLAQYDLWISHWTYDPSTSPNTGEIWDTWSFWQYSDMGTVPGISGNVFLDLFSGTNDDLQKMLLFLPPEADFTYSPKKPLIKETITFDASSSYDPNGRILLYAWSTTDGQTYLSQEPTWETRFTRAGEYTVTLEITDNDNQHDTKSFRVKATEDWTFAVITDIHMGYNDTDYGTLSWNDEGGQDYQLTTRLSTIVTWINDHEESNNIHFVAVLGDISDSGEKSELLKARDILNGLNIPYIPVIGNHDIWPYTQEDTVPVWRDYRKIGFPFTIAEWAVSAVGDQFFDEIFWQQNEGNREKIETLFEGSFAPQLDPVEYPYIQNYAFTYKGIKFIILDFIDRNPTESTQSSDAKLHSDTERWLQENLKEAEPTVLFSHHAMLSSKLGEFSHDDAEEIDRIVEESGSIVLANFAGHNHRNAEASALMTSSDLKVVTTEAVCRESTLWPSFKGTGLGVFPDRTKKNIRLVNMTWNMGYIQMKSYNTQVKIDDNDMEVPQSKWFFWANCPVDLNVTDPDGFSITKEVGAVAGMLYLEGDWDGNGEPDDLILFDDLKTGNYQIQVIPEPGASPNDTYTLRVFGIDAVTLFAENVSISDIPTEPYIVNSTVIALNNPPTTLIEIGEPKIVNGTTYVSPATPLDLIASDNSYGSGLASTVYRVYNATFDTGWIIHTKSIYLTGLSEGTYQIDYYSTDCAGNVEPTNTTTVVLKNPDIAVTNITLYKTIVGQGFNLHVNVTIQNQGTFNDNFDITLYANTTIIGTITDIVLTSGNSTAITFTWNTSGFAKGNYTISAYAWPVPGETDTADNNVTGGMVLVTLVGDVNGDRKVRIDDILAVATAFGSNWGEPKYSPNLDINDDRKIRIDDVLAAAQHFGQGPW